MCVFYMKFHVSDFVFDEFVQRVAVQHLEDRCRRALEWAQTIDPSVDCLVRNILWLASRLQILLKESLPWLSS